MTNLSTLDYVEDYTISKSLNDSTWQLTASFDKEDAPTSMIGIRAFGTDHADVEHCLFVGFIPDRNFSRQMPNNKVSITAYDFSWYLGAQHLADKDNLFIYYTTVYYDTIDDVMDALIDETGLTMGAPVTFPMDIDLWHRFYWPPDKIALDAIHDLEEYYDWQFLILNEQSGSVYTPTAYMLEEDEVDTYLPAEVTFAKPNDYVTSININERGLEVYNRVTVYGTTFWDGTWYEKTYESSGVTNGDEYPIEYFHVDATLDTQAKVDAKAWTLYAILHNTSSTTYSATFTNRYDLQLMQKVKFTGYTGISEASMRIISITYQRVLNQDSVSIAFTADQSFADLKLLARYIKEDPIQTQQQVIKDATNKLATIEIGEVLEIDASGNIATVSIERTGTRVEARII